MYIKTKSQYSCQNYRDWQLRNLIMHFHRTAAKLWLIFKYLHLQKQHFFALKEFLISFTPSTETLQCSENEASTTQTQDIVSFISYLTLIALLLGKEELNGSYSACGLCQVMTQICSWPLKSISQFLCVTGMNSKVCHFKKSKSKCHVCLQPRRVISISLVK